MKHKVREELDLVRAVLQGYPPSIAQADAMRALRVIQEETDCGPLPTEEHHVPMGFKQYSTQGRYL